MTLQSSGQISLAQIAAEFGNGADYRLSEFYRGGAEVPNIPANYGVPTGGQISFAQFYGATNYVPMNVSKSGDASGANSTGTLNAAVSVTTNSVTISVSNGAGPFTYSWSYVSGTAATVNSSSSATTSFTRVANATLYDDCVARTATYRCTVTDSTSAQATIDVTVQTNHCHVA